MVDHNNFVNTGVRDFSKVGSGLKRRAETTAIAHPRSSDKSKYWSGPDSGSRKGRKGW
jgi:hypothetical protein